MSIIVKHRTDLDLVAERVGVKLGSAEPGSRGHGVTPATAGPRAAAGVASARSFATRAPASGPLRCSTRSRRSRRCRGPSRPTSARRWPRPWRSRRRTAASSSWSSTASSSAPRRPRRSSAAVGEQHASRATARARSTSRSSARRSARRSPTATTARCATSRGSRIAAFGRQGEGSGVVGVDVQRIRRTLGLQTRPAGERRRGPAHRPRGHRPVRAPPAPRARARRHRARRALPPSAPAGRARPHAANQPGPGPRRRAPCGRAAEAQARHARPRASRAAQGTTAVDVRRTMRISLETGGVPLRLKYRPKRPRRPEIYVLCDVSTSRHLGQRLLPLGPARPPRLVSQAPQLRLHRADLRGHRGLRARAGLQDDRARRSARRAASPTSRATPTTAASGSSSASSSATTSVRARRSSSSATPARTAASRTPTSSRESQPGPGAPSGSTPSPASTGTTATR